MNQLVPRILEGELLGPDERVTVIGRPKPFKAEQIRVKLPCGLTVQELLDLALSGERSRFALDYVVYIDGDPVPPAWRSRVRVKAGRTITFAPRLHKGDVARTIALLAVAAVALVVAPWLAGPVLGLVGTALSVGTALISAGIVVAGTLAVNALFPISAAPSQIERGVGTRPNVFSIGGARNQARPWEGIPAIRGRVRVFPPYGANPYTELSGENQYLRLLFVIGYGPLDLTDLKIGETPIDQFDEVQYEIRRGYQDDLPVTLYTNQAFEQGLSVELTHAASWQVRTTAANIDEISLDVVAPNGIYRVDKDTGRFEKFRVRVQSQYRPAGSDGAWVALANLDEERERQKPLRWGLRRAVTRGQYEVRVRKASEDYDGDDQVVEQLAWTALRGFRADPPIGPGKPLAVVAMRIKATAQLNNVIDTFNCVATSRVRALTEGLPLDVPSRNPAELLLWELQGPSIHEPVPDDQIDFDSLVAFRHYCVTQGFTYDREHDSKQNVLGAAQQIAAAGRGRVTRTDGKWGAIFDEADVPVAQHFTPRNSWGFAEQRVYFEPPHALRCAFVNAEKAWQPDERMVYADGYDASNATRFEAFEFPGVTSSSLIWRHGRFHMAQAMLRPATYSLSTNWQALSCQVGSKVWVAHDVTLQGLVQCRVKAVLDDTVTLDEEVLIEPDQGYAIRFRLASGESVLRLVAPAQDGRRTSFEMVGDIELPSPSPGDLAMFGNADPGPAVLYRVKDIEWQADLRARLTLVDNAPEISAADTGTIPPYDSKVTVPPNLFGQVPYGLEIGEFIYVQDNVLKSGALLSWQSTTGNASGYEVEYKDENAVKGVFEPAGVSQPSQFGVEIRELAASSYTFRVRTLFADGTYSAWASLSSVPLFGATAQPDDVTGFRIAITGDIATLSWDPVTSIGMSHYVIRHSPSLDGATWGSASILLPHVAATSVQVPTLKGSYLIKAESRPGIQSVNPAMLIVLAGGITELNVVQTLEPHPDWLGDKLKVIESGGLLRLDGLAGVPMSEWPPMSQWSALSVAREGFLSFNDIIDLGEVFTSRVTATIQVTGDNVNNVLASWTTLADLESLSSTSASDWAVRLEMRHTNDDPGEDPEWTEWEEFRIGDVTARAFDFRLWLISFAVNVTPSVAAVTVSIDMPDRVLGLGDVAIPIGGVRVPFAEPFRHLETVLVTAIQDAGSGDYAEISNRDETGFDVIVRDASDASVARTIDASAIGYGRKKAA